jgi:hypothetical protein
MHCTFGLADPAAAMPSGPLKVQVGAPRVTTWLPVVVASITVTELPVAFLTQMWVPSASIPVGVRNKKVLLASLRTNAPVAPFISATVFATELAT